MSEKLNKNILATIIYYDGLQYPLTAFEVWKYLVRTDYYLQAEVFKISLLDVIKSLNNGELAAYIAQKNGFYFLKGQDHLMEKRIASNKISFSKIKKLRRITMLLRFVPFVRMIGITGGLAMKNANLESDWDLLIVLRSGKIWTGRTLVTGLVHLLGKRRYGKHVADRVCLNFFVTEDSLEVITKDLFSASEYMFLFPIFGWQVYQRFQLKNHWIKNMKPNYDLNELKPLKILEDTPLSKNIRTWGEAMLGFTVLEKFFKKIEKKRIMLNPKTNQEGSLVYANDDALIFLPDPHGPKLFEEFKMKVNKLSV